MKLTSRAFTLLVVVFALAVLTAPAMAADAPFTPRFAETVHGDINAVGNTMMTCAAGPACATAQNGTASGDALNDNSYTMTRVDIDGDASTFDSSSATVSLPVGSTVEWAGLYWAADTTPGVGGAAAPAAANKGTVKLKVPGGAYQTISASAADVLTSTSQASRYRAFRDVTALVPAAGSGTYTVADLQAGTGADRFGGWALFVAYRNDAQAQRRLNVYDGLGTVDATHAFLTTIAPFHTPTVGTVTTKVGLLSFEGDAGLATETATFNGHALTDALNPVNNAMNSTIESGGTRFSAKTPDYVNQLGMDLDAFTNAGALANDQSSAALSFTSTNEYFMPSAFFLTSDEAPPVVTSAGPTVGGTAQDGATLTADPGTWNGTGPLDYTYQWQRCDASGANCADIPGATHSTYTPGATDVGSTFRVIVTAGNDAGPSAPATSAPTAATLPAAPANTAAPAVGGTPAQGQTLTTDPGTWTGAGPVAYTYRWQRCDADGTNCVDISCATGASYTPGAADAGHAVRVIVTATNDGGSTSKTSGPTAPVPTDPGSAGNGSGGGAGSGGGTSNGGNGGGGSTGSGGGSGGNRPATGDPASGASDPAATDDLRTPGIEVLAETSCQQLVGGAKYRRVALKGIGTVRVRAYTTGPALASSPVKLTTEITGGRAKSVRYRLDGRAIAMARGSRHPATLTPRQLGKVGTHTLKTAVRGRRGAAKTVSLSLKTVPCQTLFTAQRWRTTAGAGLRLRIDSRTALTGLSFTVPAALLPKQAKTSRSAGFIRVYVSGRTKPLRYNLSLPKRGAKAVLLGAAGKPTVTRTRAGLRVAGLPARAAVAELTLYRVTKLDAATSRRVYKVKATVTRVGAAAQTFSAKPKPPR